MPNGTRTGIALLVLAQAIVSCDDGLGAPVSASVPSLWGQPSILEISPNAGSTGGATWVIVTGARFDPGATVTLGGTPVVGRTDLRDPTGTVMYLSTPPHAPGTVDVIVTNPGGRRAVLNAAFTYAAPESFDFNGYWLGFGDAGQDIGLGFTIRDNMLVGAFCDTEKLTFATPQPVTNGEFSYSIDGRVVLSGRIVSANGAVGTIDFAACSTTNFSVERF